MEINNNTQYQNYPPQYSDMEEEESTFDILEWLFKILHHWYLFVIALAISLSIAFIANKTWKPTYQVSARVILGGGSQSGSQQVVMQGVNLNTAYKNNDNQMIMFTSNDLVERAINKINANVDYYTTGHFKVSNLYGYAPIEIKGDNINDAVYGLEFDFKDIDGLTYEISHALSNDSLNGKMVALWGLAFKPNTDDMREAPSLVLIRKLLEAGCKVRLFDPVAMEEARKAIDRSIDPSLRQDIYFASDIYDTVNDADALMLVTEWKEFRMPNWQIVKKLMKHHIVLDGRNIYDKKEISELGFTYEGVGV